MLTSFIRSNKKTLIFLFLVMSISAFFNFYKSTETPACLNSDEVAFGYNAYAISETGKDEFGKTLPLRLQSFNDFKLPLYTYLSIPFVKIFGLNDFSTRLLNKLLGILLIPTVYVVAQRMFKDKKISYLAALLTAMAPWIYIISRHAHEGVILVFCLLWSLYFTVKFQKERKISDVVYADIFLVLSSHAYHLGRIFVLVFMFYQFLVLALHIRTHIARYKKTIAQWILVTLIALLASWGVDAAFGAPRVNSLFFFQDQGFQLSLDEKLRENNGNRIINNKLTESVIVITRKYFEQATPEFFVTKGDKNARFGFDGIGLITPIEFLFIFIGLYYLFKRKNEYRFLLVYLLVISPLPNALTWQSASLIRTYFMIFPILLTVAYGFVSLLKEQNKLSRNLIFALCIAVYSFFLIMSWDMYLNHYFKKAYITRSWQCGYKEMVEYLNSKKDTNKKVYITLKMGQPYIYLLFYNQIHPEVFQRNNVLTPPDEYGFTQVASFDRYHFEMPSKKDEKDVIYIGYPDDFEPSINMKRIKKIKLGTEEIFWIYER